MKLQKMNLRIVILLFIFPFITISFGQTVGKENIVGTTFSIQSDILNDQREIQVFLPDGYPNSDTAYPVLYILDGQRYFLHGVSLQKSFVEFKQTPEFIVVGISKNPSDRNRMFSVNSQKYLNHIKNEVLPLINKEFRTSKTRMLFGWAFGGGFVIETMIRESGLFDVYIAASPFPLKERVDKVDAFLSQKPDFSTLLYFSSGTHEGTVKEGTNALNTLLQSKAPKTMDWAFRELEGEEHRSTPFTTLYHGIRKYFKYYPELQFNNLEAFLRAGGLDHVYDYYKKRALQFGFSADLSDWTMFSLTRNAIRANDFEQFEKFVSEFESTGFISRLRVSRACVIAEFYAKHKHYDKAIEIFTLLSKKHPDSTRPLNGLGDAYKALKQHRKANRFYKKARDLSGKKSN